MSLPTVMPFLIPMDWDENTIGMWHVSFSTLLLPCSAAVWH